MRRSWKPALALLLLALPVSASSWPGSSTGTSIGTGLGSIEISGIVWDPMTSKLYSVGDEGTLIRMTSAGGSTNTWPVLYVPDPTHPTQTASPDLESIAVTGNTSKLYLGVEYDSTSQTAKILEISSTLPAPGTTITAANSWNLPATDLYVTSSSGMEGLTWVPNGHHPYPDSSSGGVFYASTQHDGSISVFDVDLSTPGSTPDFLGSFKPDPNQTDISDLYYSSATRTLFVLYDNANQVIEVDTSTTTYEKIATYTLPSGPTAPTAQEGVTLLPSCPASTTTFYIGNDTGGVYSFSSYPQLCATAYGATADASISPSSPNGNSGSATSLVADTSPVFDFFIRFSSTAGQGSIARSRLRFYVTDGTTQSPSVCGVSGSWSEGSLTWNNAPSCTSSSIGGNVNVTSGEWTSYDLAGLLGTYPSFRFTGRSSNDFVCDSKEASTGATNSHPQLVVWRN